MWAAGPPLPASRLQELLGDEYAIAGALALLTPESLNRVDTIVRSLRLGNAIELRLIHALHEQRLSESPDTIRAEHALATLIWRLESGGEA